MMGKTHIAVGIASAVAIAQPATVRECFTAILGGAIGGLICDLDTKANQYGKDGLFSRILVIALAAVILLSDRLLNTGIWVYILAHAGTPLFTGLLLFAVACLGGILSSHRSFAHSLPALALMAYSLHLVYAPIVPSFAIGFLSHVALDLLNKKSIQLFFPLPIRFCFNLFYADGVANNVFLYLGIAANALLLLRYLLQFAAF